MKKIEPIEWFMGIAVIAWALIATFPQLIVNLR